MTTLTSDTIAVIKKSLQGCYDNTHTFPEHVKNIASIGITAYTVDLNKHEINYYLANGTSYTENIPVITRHTNQQIFDKQGVKSAITDVQQRKIDYPIFLERIVSAGTKSYEVNIGKGIVVYHGENDSHVEPFPRLTNA